MSNWFVLEREDLSHLLLSFSMTQKGESEMFYAKATFYPIKEIKKNISIVEKAEISTLIQQSKSNK